MLAPILEKAASEAKFGLHSKCAQPRLTHLSFADDVMIFTEATASSLEQVMKVLPDFGTFSGLKLNLEKSELFTSGISDEDSVMLCSSLGLSKGQLPVRYLGIPLSPTRLSKSYYQPIIDRIKAKLESWTTKLLSLAGKVQLIATSIYGLVHAWSSVFLLPKYLLKLIDGLCSAFLWKNSACTSCSYRVAWNKICVPRSEGGLGLRKLEECNVVFRLKLVWLLLTKSGSLWVAWLRQNVFKRRGLWDTNATPSYSWNLNKLLRLRHIARNFVKVELGDGYNTRFWTDNWSRFGPLIDVIGEHGPRLMRLPRCCLVKDAIESGGWSLPGACSARIHELHIALTGIPPPTKEQARIYHCGSMEMMTTGTHSQPQRHGGFFDPHHPRLPGIRLFGSVLRFLDTL
ncbi:PREDICTED: uncharacterized protein LOC104810684 [Tarenaya hassleriana]|uniref:uncharacterized protein LOC104810684 n=1 Tax=Tarenaya hassleriana TaxID=28532 RepID=UPI00053C3D55|nr:PREDICTED: uncharacterized protein LOC104810684 [Tarenaya hassleriana]